MGMVLYLRQASYAEFEERRRSGWELAEFTFEDEVDQNVRIDFDKAWQALHFLLCGQAWGGVLPLAMLLNEYEQSEEDIGYGPCWFVPPETMTAFHRALTEFSDDDLRRRYDPSAMAAADVYMADVLLDEAQEGLNYVMQGVPRLREFAAACSVNGNGAIGGIS